MKRNKAFDVYISLIAAGAALTATASGSAATHRLAAITWQARARPTRAHLSSSTRARSTRARPRSPPTRPTGHPDVKDILLVHGSFADGSSWSGVIEALQRKGFTTTALQLCEKSLAEDAEQVRYALTKNRRPMVVAAHSYGGAVISEATAGAENVRALVFVAAFAPDHGETLGELAPRYPTPGLEQLTVDDRGFATIKPEGFLRYFAPDVPPERARVMEAAQHPIASSTFSERAGRPGWKTVRGFYQVSTNDQIIHSELERFFAKRMRAKMFEIQSSHVSLVSHSRAVAEIIERAAEVNHDGK